MHGFSTHLPCELSRLHCTRTLNEIINLLKEAVHFAVFNNTQRCQEILSCAMAEASKLLTAMLTPVGICLYNVLAMDFSNTADIFNFCIHKILEGLNGIINIAGDVLVFGTDYKLFKKNVIGFLYWCEEKDLHLNTDKICINVPNIPFFGQVLTSQCLQPDPCKVDIIIQQ